MNGVASGGGGSGGNGNGSGGGGGGGGGAPTAMYRPNFSQAFQRAGPTTVPPTLSAGLYPTQSFTSGLLSNGTQSNSDFIFFFLVVKNIIEFPNKYFYHFQFYF